MEKTNEKSIENVQEYEHGPQCWPPSMCIDPDNCPFVYAVLMENAEELVI